MTPSTNPARDEAWPESLAEHLAERHKRLMLETEREAFQAAQLGDKARQSLASTESERHRAVYHAMCLIIADENRRRVAPSPAGGVDAVAAIIAKWVDEKRFADAPAFRMAAREIIASLSPAATSGSEAGGEQWSADQIATIWTAAMTAACNIVIHRQNDLNDDDGPVDVLNEQGQIIRQIKKWLKPDAAYLEELRTMLGAKPSSPAGGDVVERVAAVIDPEIWAIEQPVPTRARVEDFHQRRRSSCELAQRIIAALSPSTSAAEPVAWRWRLKDRTEWIVTSDHEDIPKQFRVTGRDKASRFEYPEIQPLYAHPAPAAVESAQGVKAWDDVLAERRRQIEAEGWTPEHDDAHDKREMACAAACYALTWTLSPTNDKYVPHKFWPWSLDWWKPADPRRNLVKAGALILAEIERLDRASLATEKEG